MPAAELDPLVGHPACVAAAAMPLAIGGISGAPGVWGCVSACMSACVCVAALLFLQGKVTQEVSEPLEASRRRGAERGL